ncbi:MAG: hypothetical protein MJZ66_03150 [Bacteroidales bacterium]|nr:hypothetical protein [Bacteroidales bacterium]MCQ2252779.1 hypothetical protein [Bacteroidales bacterium]
MSKILKLNKLMVAAVIVASLMGCSGNKGNSDNGGAQNANEAAEKPLTADEHSQIVEEVIKQQEDESPKSVDDEPLPLEMIKQTYKVPAELKYYQGTDEFLHEKIFPIGWSKDGYFAYALEPIDEAAGIYFFNLVIRNMISGQDVYVWKQEDEERESGSIKEMWSENNITFAEKLNEYKIIPQNDIKLLGTEFQAMGNKYKVTIENKMETDPDFGFEVVKTTNIFLKSPELGTKQVYSYTENDFNICLGRFVQGVIKSPYEDRVAVFVRAEERGFEGPPNLIKTLLVGCDLERSFKK